MFVEIPRGKVLIELPNFQRPAVNERTGLAARFHGPGQA